MMKTQLMKVQAEGAAECGNDRPCHKYNPACAGTLSQRAQLHQKRHALK